MAPLHPRINRRLLWIEHRLYALPDINQEYRDDPAWRWQSEEAMWRRFNPFAFLFVCLWKGHDSPGLSYDPGYTLAWYNYCRRCGKLLRRVVTG